MLPRILETLLELTSPAYFYINNAKSFKQNGALPKIRVLNDYQIQIVMGADRARPPGLFFSTWNRALETLAKLGLAFLSHVNERAHGGGASPHNGS